MEEMPDGAPLDLQDLLRKHEARVRRVLCRHGVAPGDLADAQQEVFLVAHRKLAEFEGRSQLSTWLHRIAWNVASEHRRKAHRRREVSEADFSSLASTSNPHASLEAREASARLERAFSALPSAQQEAFMLHVGMELEMHEVARELGVPLKTAFSRLYAARRALKRALEPEDKGKLRAGLLALLLSALHEGRVRALVGRLASPVAIVRLQLAAIALVCAGIVPVTRAPVRLQEPSPPVTESPRLVVSRRMPSASPDAAAALEVLDEAAPRVPEKRAKRTPRVAREAAHAPALESPTLPSMASIPSTTQLAPEELIVVHTSTIEPEAEHPFAERLGLVPERAPRSVQLRGPREPASALEELLGAAHGR